MIRFLVRLAGCFLLAAAVVFAVGDIARSMSVDAMRLTPLAEVFALFGGGEPAVAPAPGTQLWRESLGELRTVSADWPASIVLGTAAFVLLVLAQPRRSSRRALR